MGGPFRRFIDSAKSPEFRSFLMSTHFWGPFVNWSIPLAALGDISNQHPKFISGKMTFALDIYSIIFMRFAYKVKPRNWLLFACHFTNFIAQSVQICRFINYYYLEENWQI